MRFAISQEKYAYYKRLALPVLLVRWVEKTDSFFARWVDELDRYEDEKAGRSSVSVRFSEEDRWVDATPKGLLIELRRYERAKHPSFSFPISLQMNFKCDKINNIPAYEIRSAIMKENDEAKFVLLDRRNSELDPMAVASFDTDQMAVRIASRWGCTFHGIEKVTPEDTPQLIPKVMFVCLAIALVRIGHRRMAARIAKRYRTFIAQTTTTLSVELLPVLVAAGEHDAALEIYKNVLRDSDDTLVEMSMHVSLLGSRRGSERDEDFKKIVRTFLEDEIARHKEKGDSGRAGIAHYNLGNFLRGKISRSWGVHHYKMAARLEPRYLEKEYYLKEFAGLLFVARRFRLSEHYYRMALDAGTTGLCSALHADALLFSGHYEEALTAFRAYNSSGETAVDPEFVIKEEAVRFLMEFTGIVDQKRNETEGRRGVGVRADEAKRDSIDRLTANLRRHDALNGLTWFNLGILFSEVSEFENSTMSFLLAGFANTADVEAWRNAFFQALNAGGDYLTLAQSVAIVAYGFCRNEFRDKMIEYREHFPQPELYDALIEGLDEVFTARSSSRLDEPPFEIRLFE